MLRIALTLLLVCGPALAGELDDARQLIEAENYEEASSLLEKAAKKSNTKAQALLMLTEVCNLTENYKDGVDYGKQVVKALPDSSDAHYQYAVAIRLKMSAGSKVKALFAIKSYKKELARAIELDPANVDALTEQIVFLTNAPGFAGGDLDEARPKIAELEKLDWKLAKIMLANLERTAERPEKALEAYQAVLEKEPDDVAIRYAAAYLLQQLGRWTEADAQFAQIAESDDEVNALGALYQRARTRILGQYEPEKAVEQLQSYIEGFPDEPAGLPPISAAHWRMGMAYEQLDQTADARTAYQTALRLNPEDKEAKQALEALGK